ncbi:hypothetical protein L596_000823 [Steinernema carpocapsae]|uniref:DNA-directed DNA polymerase n=1 Tax=Steinernema carpocapsae TaxID=34508 RepID=A0A4U8UKI5_STECR|nr:hypothetical protein L596_000823 [Steinernema carpocapsae]
MKTVDSDKHKCFWKAYSLQQRQNYIANQAPLKAIFYDFETVQSETDKSGKIKMLNEHSVNMAIAQKVCKTNCGQGERIFSYKFVQPGNTVIAEFAQWLFEDLTNVGYVGLAHFIILWYNLKHIFSNWQEMRSSLSIRTQSNFPRHPKLLTREVGTSRLPSAKRFRTNGRTRSNTLSTLNDDEDGVEPAQQITRRDNTAVKTRARLILKDSFSYIPFKLEKFAKTFTLAEDKKGFFLYKGNCEFFYGKKLEKHLPLQFYEPDRMGTKKLEEFLKWYDEHHQQQYDFDRELEDYCRSDVNLLRKGHLPPCDICKNHSVLQALGL